MGRSLAWLGSPVALTGCGATWHPQRPGDTACLTNQAVDFHVAMYRALMACGTPRPDLTGNRDLRAYAREWSIPDTVDAALDAKLMDRGRYGWSYRSTAPNPGATPLVPAEIIQR